METAYCGMPYRKFTVPSIGSTTHCTPLRDTALAPSSPRKPSSGRTASSRSKISVSAARSTSVTTSTGLDLVAATSTPSRRRTRTSSAASRATDVARSRSSSYAGAGTSVPPAQGGSVAPGVGAASGRAHVPRRWERADGGPHRRLAALGRRALHEQAAHHRDEARVQAGRRRAGEGQSELLGCGTCLGVEVVDDLHVVGDEADRHHHDPG